jgi:hypothetical protein
MAMRHRVRIFAVAGVLAALGLAVDASAQPAQVEQGPQIGAALAVKSAVPFEQYVFRDPCPLGTVCTLDFVTVPAGSRLSINNTSCYVKFDNSKGNADVDFLTLVVSNKTREIVPITLVPFFVSSANNFVVVSANHVVSAFANAGLHFQAKFGLTSAAPVPLFACHISGQLQKLG